MEKIKPKFVLFVLAILISINSGAAFSKPSYCNDLRGESHVESAKTYIKSWLDSNPMPPEQIALEDVGYALQLSSIRYRKRTPRGGIGIPLAENLVTYAVLSATLTNNSKYSTLETACFKCKYFDSQGNLIPVSHSWGRRADMDLGVLLNPGKTKQTSTQMWYTENEGRMISKYQCSLYNAW